MPARQRDGVGGGATVALKKCLQHDGVLVVPTTVLPSQVDHSTRYHVTTPPGTTCPPQDISLCAASLILTSLLFRVLEVERNELMASNVKLKDDNELAQKSVEEFQLIRQGIVSLL